jgi:D-3-phosphoglycerate dehydrogenase / 2-oxoglutarate reductase
MRQVKTLIISPIDGEAILTLQQRHEVRCAFDADEGTLLPLIADREVLIFRSGVSVTARVLEEARALRMLLRAGSGLDNLNQECARERGLELVRVPGPGARAVAEMAFALMLGLARQLLLADGLLRQGRWAKNEMVGHLLTNKTLGVVGAGNIGTLVGQLGATWGMNVLGCVDNASPAEAARLAGHRIRLAPFTEVLEQADFLCLHVPLQDSTRHLIGAEALARMKPGAFLVNLARGGVVDEEALRAALLSGRLAGAALDVHRAEGEGKISPVADLDNVILTPHIGATTIDSQREIGRRVVEIVDDFAVRCAPPALPSTHRLETRPASSGG